jgi:hypothetical protein
LVLPLADRYRRNITGASWILEFIPIVFSATEFQSLKNSRLSAVSSERLPKNAKLTVGFDAHRLPHHMRKRNQSLGYLEKLSDLLKPDLLLTNFAHNSARAMLLSTAHMNSLGQSYLPQYSKGTGENP